MVAHLMSRQISWNKMTLISIIIVLTCSFLPFYVAASDTPRITSGNFGLPGIIDLPTARRLSDGELVVTQQIHKSLARSGISFQVLPRVGVSFRYSGHGIGGKEAHGRFNHDRSFDAHISIFNERKYFPAISLGLRDFIGTGWYSSEYIVGTKSNGNLELTAGLGFGRLAGKNTFSNPLGALSSRFDHRDKNKYGKGGTLGTINWFQGDASAFYGIQYHINEKITISAEYTSDLMSREKAYLSIESPWNWGASYQLNDYFNISTQYLHGNQVSVTGQIALNPNHPPLKGGRDLAPVPMRLRGTNALALETNDEGVIRKVLAADQFEIHRLEIENATATAVITNTKFRSTAQAVGRVASTLQRFTSDRIKFANISFYSGDLQIVTYRVNLEKITKEQFDPEAPTRGNASIIAVDMDAIPKKEKEKHFTWGVGPYIAHRLFNPDLPLSMETGIEVTAGYQIANGLEISGAIRKSVLTNFTDNKRRSNSALPHVHSDWVLYDLAGQSGHIHELKLSYFKNLAPGLYSKAHAGLLERMYAGVGGEILYKPAQWPIGIGLDIHHVWNRDYDMKFDLLNYQTTVGHVSLYYDAGGMFDIELNAGRYLARDWGVTTTISRQFGSGWIVGGYATLTDVPFDVFGEGSFDKAIFVSVPIDWITSSPNQAQRILTLRPITRDGGANLASARSLNKQIKRSHNAAFQREFGRLWK